MADYHFVYKDVEGTSTEWEDLQRKYGNLPPKPPVFKPDPFAPAQDEDSKPKDKSWIDNKTEEELEDLEDDLDDDRFLEEYRRKRLSEMKQMVKIAKFGSVIPISGSDFVREVSQAPSDVWVVVILYKDGYPECGVLMQCLEELAKMYPATKFVRIISTDCIPKYPDCVALILCQSDPVLDDGQSEGEASREAVIEGVRKRFIERVVTQHENDDDDDGSTSD
ncbi:Phosducin, thioredoxin-like domain-containing protein [Cynara cardunculus var. scolymus]|uniref:Phosducin, thioredoxin-like domain-containing protein n=1 Tax=Cynara cardunculus var. scolymus TaxID=59895 RepID=A0A103Y4U5_CYNCS|nr:Phosducin, thioredoxin-like domain-containing protein [Cynara cardunculus var. scolymus]